MRFGLHPQFWSLCRSAALPLFLYYVCLSTFRRCRHFSHFAIQPDGHSVRLNRNLVDCRFCHLLRFANEICDGYTTIIRIANGQAGENLHSIFLPFFPLYKAIMVESNNNAHRLRCRYRFMFNNYDWLNLNMKFALLLFRTVPFLAVSKNTPKCTTYCVRYSHFSSFW